MLRLVARSFLGVALALSIAGHAGAITAWDQARVTELATQLASALNGLRDAIRTSPQWTFPGRRTVLFQIRDNLRWMENESVHLRAELTNGADMEATLNSYRRIQMLRRDTLALAQQAGTTAFVEPWIEKSRAAFEGLATFYPADATSP